MPNGTEMSLKEFTDHLPQNHRIKAEMNAIVNTIGLLSCMVRCGEEHSKTSEAEVTQALEFLRGF